MQLPFLGAPPSHDEVEFLIEQETQAAGVIRPRVRPLAENEDE